MRIAVLHHALAPDAPKDELDVLDEVEAVTEALRGLGHEPFVLKASLDLGALERALAETQPDLVFNLVESLAGQGRLIHLVPSVLSALGLPFTGSSAEAILLSTHKPLAKRLLKMHALPTPAWEEAEPNGPVGRFEPGRYIIKSVFEHASIGLDEGAIVEAATREELRSEIDARAPMLGGEGFAERYIDGREFDLAMLAGARGIEILPAELDFSAYPEGKPRFVSYTAKWDVGSFEWENTLRNFDFAPADDSLIVRMRHLARECWRIFGLRGFGRVDFRVDKHGQPWILEVNANPCLSPDAGLAEALEHAEIPYAEAIRRIVEDGVAHGPASARIRAAGAGNR